MRHQRSPRFAPERARPAVAGGSRSPASAAPQCLPQRWGWGKQIGCTIVPKSKARRALGQRLRRYFTRRRFRGGVRGFRGAATSSRGRSQASGMPRRRASETLGRARRAFRQNARLPAHVRYDLPKLILREGHVALCRGRGRASSGMLRHSRSAKTTQCATPEAPGATDRLRPLAAMAGARQITTHSHSKQSS